MSSAPERLSTLGTEAFPDLTEAEQKLLRAITVGKPADYAHPTGADNDPRHADTWGESRAIRAEVIRWLCIDREAIRLIDPWGIRVCFANIRGKLNLDSVTIPFPLALESCGIRDGVVLKFAESRLLSFMNSVSPSGISGDSLIVHGSILLGGLRARVVYLPRAKITGTLDCSGGVFLNPGNTSFEASAITIGGDVFLRGFHADGQVRLGSANMTGSLDCSGGVFHNPGNIALEASATTIGGHVFLRQDFNAEGEVRLVAAKITGDLDCSGGVFHNSTGNAVSADKITIRKDVFLRDGFRAEGGVRLVGGNIGGDLDFSKIGSSTMILHLAGATVGRLIYDTESWRKLRAVHLEDFVYTAIAGEPDKESTVGVEAWLCWLEKQPSKPFRPQPYQQLAKVLREGGQEAEAKQILIAKEQARRKRGDLGWSAWCWSWVLAITIGYGYRPYQALLWAVCFIVLGGLLFGEGNNEEMIIPAKKDAYPDYQQNRQLPSFYPTFNPWVYSLDTFLPIVSLGQKNYWEPKPTCSRDGGDTVIKHLVVVVTGCDFLRLYRLGLIIAGWALTTLFVAGFTNLVRKE